MDIPIEDFAGNGTTNDTANFAALREDNPSPRFDLLGKTYLVDQIPPGPFTNGWFKVGNYLHSADKLVQRDYFVTDGDEIANWPQDQAHVDTDRGIRYVGYGSGALHGAVDNVANLIASANRGQTWRKELTVSDVNYSVWTASMGILHGNQYRIERRADANNATVSFRMFRRHLLRKYKMTNVISTALSSSQVTITFPSQHGLLTGDTINIGSAKTVNGVTISTGSKTVTRVDTISIQITGMGMANATQVSAGGVVRITVPQSPWIERTFSGSTLGDAMKSASGLTTLPTTVQSFAGYSNARAFVGVSGSGYMGVMAFTNLGAAAETLVYRPFASPTGRTEPSLCLGFDEDDQVDYLYGLTRVGSPSYNTKFWWSSGILSPSSMAITESDFPFYISEDNPAPIRFHRGTNTLYGFTSRRVRNGSGPVLGTEELEMWLLVADATEARMNGASAFKVIQLAETTRSVPMNYYGDDSSTTAAQCGVPSLAIDGNTLIAYISEEQGFLTPAGAEVQRSNIRALEFDLTTRIAG